MVVPPILNTCTVTPPYEEVSAAQAAQLCARSCSWAIPHRRQHDVLGLEVAMHDAVGVQELQAAGHVQRHAAALLEPAELGVAAAAYGVRQVAALPKTQKKEMFPSVVVPSLKFRSQYTWVDVGSSSGQPAQ